MVAPAQTPDSLICPAHTHARSGGSASRRRCARPQCHLSTVMQVTCLEGGGLEHLRGGWPFICMWVRRGQCPRASSIAHGEDRSAEAPWSPSPRGDRPSCPDRLPRLASPDQPGHSRTRAVRCEFPPYRRVHECPSRRWVRGLRRSGEDSEEAQSRRARTAASSSRSATRQLAAVVSDEPSKPP